MKLHLLALSLLLSLANLGCSSDSTTNTPDSQSPSTTRYPFTLEFSARVNDMEYLCDDTYSGLGPNGDYAIGITDLRFYVSNLQAFAGDGSAIALTLDENDFQLTHSEGTVALIDLSHNSSGYCDEASEGTARTNAVIIGTSSDSAIAAIEFDVGVPQAVMKAVIASTDNVAEVPSPLNELYWSWASGYRHFVMGFSVMDATHTDMIENSGFHLGSRDCGGVDKALDDQDSCGLLNTPHVRLENFAPDTQKVVVDINALLANATAEHFAPNGTPGLQCHSAQMQAACQALFPNYGLTLADGTASADNNTVFVAQ